MYYAENLMKNPILTKSEFDHIIRIVVKELILSEKQPDDCSSLVRHMNNKSILDVDYDSFIENILDIDAHYIALVYDLFVIKEKEKIFSIYKLILDKNGTLALEKK